MAKTNTAENALLKYEAGQELVAMAAMTNSGDNKTFSTPNAISWSNRTGYEPKICPNGLDTGNKVTPGTAPDTASVPALTCWLSGVKKAVAADNAVAITRPTGGATHNISSITINSAGAIAVVKGTDGTSHSAIRGAAGGPPLIPVGSIERAQVKLSSETSAVITEAEISQAVGSSCEKSDYPVWDENNFTGEITFASALPAIHVGGVCKGVYAEVCEPVFADIDPVVDFKPPENTYSVSSTQVYGGTVGATSKSLGQGGFKAYVKDGISDAIAKLEGENLFFKFFPNRYKTAYKICQGILGITSSYPAGANIQLDCTISASEKAKGVDA